MRRTPSLICAGSIAAFIAAVAASRSTSRAATVYWDPINGNSTGTGSVSPVGTWSSSSTVWNPSSIGIATPSSWVSGDTAVFSAGSDATGSYTVTVDGTQTIGGIIFEDGTPRLTGGTLMLTSPVFSSVDLFVNSGAAARIDSVLAGDFGINKTGLGSLRLGGVNTFTGPVTVSFGTLSATSASAFGTGTSTITVTGNSTRGTGGGQLVLGDVTLNRPLFVTGLGPGGDASALFLSGDNNLSSLTTGATATTRISASGGINTIDFFVGGAGQNSQFNGSGHFIINNLAISGQASSLLQKAGSGGMIILEGDNLIENEIRQNAGSLRMSSGQNVPIISPEGGVLELRTDKASSFVDTRLIERTSHTIFVDRAVGSTQGLLNQTVAFSDTSYLNNGQTSTYTGRNGYNLSLGGAGGPAGIIPFATGGNHTISNTLNGRLIFDGSLSFTDGASRSYVFAGNGDTTITGSILGTGGVHVLTKQGTGTLTIGGSASTNNGGIAVTAGTVAANRLTGAGNGVISLGATTVAGSFNYLGDALTGNGETSAKIFSLNGTTGAGIIRTNQIGSALTLTSNIGAGGAGAKNLVLGGTSTAENTITGLILDNTVAAANRTSVIKTGPGTWVYSPEAAHYASTQNPTTGAATTNSAIAQDGQSNITLADVTGVAIGQLVTGTNIPANSIITQINGNVITINTTIVTDVAADTTLTFGAPTNTNRLFVSSTSGLVLGQSVTGTNVPANSVVTGIDTVNNIVTISNNIATSVGSASVLTFGAAASFTGGITVAGGTLKMKPTALPSGNGSNLVNNTTGTLTFGADATTGNGYAGGTFEYVGLNNGASTESLAALSAAAGAGTVKLTPTGGSGTVSLTFSGLTATASGASLNFQVPSGGTVILGTGSGFQGSRTYYNGGDFVFASGSPTITLRPINYAVANTDTANTVGVGAALLTATHNLINTGSGTSGAVAQGSSVSVTSLKLLGNVSINEGVGTTVTITSGGLLATGGTSVITGGNGITTTGEMVIRVDGASDQLTMSSPIAGTGLSKNGAGKLILGAGNPYTGTTTINEGIIELATGGRLGGGAPSNNNNLVIRQGAMLDLKGVNGIGVGAFSGPGTVTNSSGTPVTFTIGNGGATNTVYSGLVSGNLGLTKTGAGSMSLTGLNTYTGVTTVNAGTLVVNNLANGGQPSSIGQSGNAASNLILSGATLLYQGANLLTFQETNTPSVSTDRLFTMAGNVVIDSSGSFGNNILAAPSANHASLIFSNPGAIAQTGATPRTLTLQGSSVGDNEMRPQLSNPAGTTLAVTKAGAGVWILNPSNPNNYTGATTITGGILQATDGAGVPTTSLLTLNGGVFQSVGGLFTRAVGSGAGQIQWLGSGGFAAAGTRLTVNLGGAAAPLTWGVGGFVNSTLILNSATALADVNFVNPIDLNGAVRTVQVDDNGGTALDFAALSGVLSGSGGLTKTNTGTLYLIGENTYTGNTTLNQGTMVINSLGGSANPASSSLGAAGGTLTLNTVNTPVLNYTGTGEASDREIIFTGASGGAVIEANGSGALLLSKITIGDPAVGVVTKTLTLRGFNSDANEITANLVNGPEGSDDVLAVSKTENGTWILSGQNTYTGTTTISAGSLGVGNDGALSAGSVTIGAASIFAAGGDRTITNNMTWASNSNVVVFGDFGLTLGTGPGTTITIGTSGSTSNTTLTNAIAVGKTLTINANVINGDPAPGSNALRSLAINGSGTTIINGQIQNHAGGRSMGVAYSGTGVLILNGNNNGAGGYTGTTVISAGALQAEDGVGLPSASVLQLANGVFQTTTGSFNRILGSGAGEVQWTAGGGFSAVGQKLKIDFPQITPLVWGGGTQGTQGAAATLGFISGGNSLVFGSTTSDAELEFADHLDFNNTDAAVNRTIVVNDNPAVNTDFTRITGQITRSGSGAVGLIKNGAGTLILENSAVNNSNAFGGTIQVLAGTLVLNGSPSVGSGGALTMAPSATGSNFVLGPGVSILRAGNFTLNQGTFAGNATISGGTGSEIILNATATNLERVFTINDNPLTVDDMVISVPLINGSGAGRVTFRREGAGQLVLQGDNTWAGPSILYKGTTIIDYGLSTGEKLVDTADLETRGGHLIFRGNASGAVSETVGNLSPGSSNIGIQNAVPNATPDGALNGSVGGITTLSATVFSNGGVSNITLQPVGSQPLDLTFRGFIRSPGGGMALLSSTGASGVFHTPQGGDVANGRLLTTNVLLDGRWIARTPIGDTITQHFGVPEPDSSFWGPTRTYEVNGAVPVSARLATNSVPGVIFSSAVDTNLKINNEARALTIDGGAILVAPESTASLVEITGGKLMTNLNYKSAAGTDLQLQNMSTGWLKISSNILNSAPLSNVQYITIAGNGPGTGFVELAGKSTSVLTYSTSALLRGAVKIIGGATLRVSGGDAISDYQAIDLGTAGNIGGNLQLNGSSETVGGFLNVNTAQGVTTGSVDLGAGGALTLNQNLVGAFAGSIIGQGSFIKQGNAIFTSNGSALTFNGGVQVTGGLFDLTGNLTDGLTGNITNLLLRGGEIRGEHNSGGLIAINKLPDAATVTLDGTRDFGLRITSNTSGRSDSVQVIQIANGANTITVDAANATSQLTLRATDPTKGLERTGLGTLLIKGDGLGGGVGGSLNNSARIMINSGAGSLGLVGGTGATLTSNPILPWAIGSSADPTATAATVVGDSFVTYGPNGLRPLAVSEYSSNYATAGSLDNFSTSTSTGTVAGKTLNSLRLDNVAGAVSMDLTGASVLTLNSGAILVSAGNTTNSAAITGSLARLDPGASKELIVHVTSSNATPASAVLTIGAQITNNAIGDGVVSVTKSGAGTLLLTNTNTFTGGLTINQGTVEYNIFNAPMLGASSGQIRLSGGTLKYSGISNSSLTSHPIVLSGPSSYYTPTGTGAAGNALNRGSAIDVANPGTNLTIGGVAGLTGTGGLVKLGAGNLIVSGPATYTGTTAIMQGNATFNALTGGPGPMDFSQGLFVIPENVVGGPIATNNTVVVNILGDLRVNQLIAGGVFTAASTQTGVGQIFVGNSMNHPAVQIGNGGGDSFLLIGYHDDAAGNLVSTNPPTKTQGALNMAQASSVDINVSRIFIGQHKGAGSGVVDGDLTFPISNGTTSKVTAGIMVVGNSPGPDSITGGGSAFVRLGAGGAITEFNIDTLILGGQNAHGSMSLDLGGNFKLRDRSGEGGANLFIGDNDDLTNTTQRAEFNKLDTSSGTIDAKLNLLVIARHGGNTTTTAASGAGAGALIFSEGIVEATTVRLALVSQRGITNENVNGIDIRQSTVAEITQDAGIFRFGDMSQGDGKVVYNWNGGTIGPVTGMNGVNHNVNIITKSDEGNPHFVDVPAGRTLTFELNAGFGGDGDITKVGEGTLIMKSSNSLNNYSGLGTFVNQGTLLANNTDFSATGGGPVYVGPDGTLGGSGRIAGDVRVRSALNPEDPGGKLIVGAAAGAIGQLRFGSGSGGGFLDMETNSILEIEIMTNTGTDTPLTDLLTIEGVLTLDAWEFGSNEDGDPFTTTELRITDLNPRALGLDDEGKTLTFIQTLQGWDGVNLFKIGDQLITDYDEFVNPDSTIFYISGNPFRMDYNGGNGTEIMLIAIPEPGALASLVGGMGMLLGLQRFRRWSAKGRS